MRNRILLPGILAALFLALPGIATAAGPANSARQDLDFGRADEALQSLSATLAQNPKDAQAMNLRCRVFYQEEQWDRAIADCEAAVELNPADSNFHLWLGRAYGQKAAHASLVSSYPLARRVRAEFEQAVQLDPHNAAALAELGEFDVMAPLVVGGGLAKAEALVPELRTGAPGASLYLTARIAEERKDYTAAEAGFKSAIRQSSYPADAWMDIASFYRRRGRFAEMLTAAHTGASLDSSHGSALVDGASNLALAGREPQTAIQWLQLYLTSHAQSEIAPSFVVRAQLARLLRQQGDPQAAQQQLVVVHTLASAYRIPSSIQASARTGL